MAKKFIQNFRDDDKLSMKSFAKMVQRQYKLNVSRSNLARARRLALQEIHGDEDNQYNLFWDYAEELRNTNLGSNFFLSLNDISQFNTLYISLDAYKRGWLKGCRPIICLGGTHIKTKYGGQLLTIVGVDPNNSIYRIAMIVVEVECYNSWAWFLHTLKSDLNIVNTSPFTIMSDKQKVVRELIPDREHRLCVRHLWMNMNMLHKGETLKNHLWACARSTQVSQWEKNMAKMKEDCPSAWEWLQECPTNEWCRAFFSDLSKCDILLNSTCKVFNKYILDARELPIGEDQITINEHVLHKGERGFGKVDRKSVPQDSKEGTKECSRLVT